MSVDLSALNVEELNAVIAQAQALISSKKDDEMKKTYAEFVEKAAALGFTVDELISQAAKPTKKVASTRKPVAVRYRNPENGEETWTGRGKQPRWLAAKLAAGANLESFAV